MSKFIVVNIGCLECGVSSNIVGVFEDEAKAEAIAEACDDKYSWREGGQNDFLVFKLPPFEVIAEEYADVNPDVTKQGKSPSAEKVEKQGKTAES